MEVKLIAMTPQPEKVMWTAARTCYSSSSPIYLFNEDVTSEECWKLISKVLGSGHNSVAEHVSFTFAIDGISRACYDDKTEVLTNNGWKLFKDVLESDKFATMDDKGLVEFQQATDFIRYEYKGKLHKYLSQNVDLCVTPNHNLFVKKYDIRTKANFTLTPSDCICVNRFYMTKEFNYNPIVNENIQIDGYTYTRRYKNNTYGEVKTKDLIIPKNILFPFMAWYLSDGNVYYRKEENSYSINIAQTQCEENLKNGTRERIENLINNLGFKATVGKATIRFKDLTMGKFLKELGHCDEKVIPWDIYKEFNQPLAKLFIDEYFKGDGNIDKNGCGKLYTSSEKLAEQLYQLCFIAGYTCKLHKINPRDPHYIGNQLVRSLKPSYVLNVTLTEKGRNKNIVIKKNKHYSEIDYDGYVYCVTVPNHTLFVRRNNVAIWCGNCSHQLVRHRHCTFSQKSQRYVEIKENHGELFDLISGFPTDEKIAKMKEIAEKYFVDVTDNNYYGYIHDLFVYTSRIANGEKAEDARNSLPGATKTDIVMTTNLRNLMHMCDLRLCSRAQLEIRQLFKAIVREVKTENVEIGKLLMAQCERLGYCPEHKSCGRMPVRG